MNWKQANLCITILDLAHPNDNFVQVQLLSKDNCAVGGRVIDVVNTYSTTELLCGVISALEHNISWMREQSTDYVQEIMQVLSSLCLEADAESKETVKNGGTDGIERSG